MLRKQKAASNVQARLLCAEVYRDANPVCRCFRQPSEYTAGCGYVQTSAPMQSGKQNQRPEEGSIPLNNPPHIEPETLELNGRPVGHEI